MPDARQPPYLIKLLDDDSLVTREMVLDQLLSFGDDLDRELDRQHLELTKEYKIGIHRLFDESRRKWLKEHRHRVM